MILLAAPDFTSCRDLWDFFQVMFVLCSFMEIRSENNNNPPKNTLPLKKKNKPTKQKKTCCKSNGSVSVEIWCFPLKSLVLAGSLDGLLRTGIHMVRPSLASSFCLCCGDFRQFWVILVLPQDGAVACEECYYLISHVKLNLISPLLFRVLCDCIKIPDVRFWVSAWLAHLSTCCSDCFFLYLNVNLDLAANVERQKNTILVQFNTSLPAKDKLHCGALRLFWVNSLCGHLTHPNVLGRTFSWYKCHGSIENVSCWDPASDCSRRVVWTGGCVSAGMRVQRRHGTIFIMRAVAWRCSLLWALKLTWAINYSCN